MRGRQQWRCFHDRADARADARADGQADARAHNEHIRPYLHALRVRPIRPEQQGRLLLRDVRRGSSRVRPGLQYVPDRRHVPRLVRAVYADDRADARRADARRADARADGQADDCTHDCWGFGNHLPAARQQLQYIQQAVLRRHHLQFQRKQWCVELPG